MSSSQARRARLRGKRPAARSPFRNVSNVANILGRVSYYHPTKGWRFRVPNPRLILSLAAAGKLA